jgi:hypothetical protein
MQGHRAAGGLLLASAVVQLIAGEFAFLQGGLGLTLLLVQEQAKSDLLRLLVFCWCLFSVGFALFLALGSGVWLGLLPAVLYAGSVASLMLEGLTRAQVLLLLAAAIGSVILAVFIGEPNAA